MKLSAERWIKKNYFRKVVCALNFRGYQSDVDIYTFHDDFNKLYQRTTPKRLMPDLLKINHLKEPALSLVKSIDDIDNIWSTLIAAYGDAKMMFRQEN